MTSWAATERQIKRAADLMTPQQREAFYVDLVALAETRKRAMESRQFWADCERAACERGNHTPSNYYSHAGSPCSRCGVHVPYDPFDSIF